MNVALAQVREAAIGNLENATCSTPLRMINVASGLGRYILVEYGDGYDASRIVLPRFRKMLLTNLGSPVFVGLPAKDLMICWSADLADQAAMIRAVEAAAKDLPYPLSSRIYMLTDDGVVGCPASARGSQSTNRGDTTPLM